MKKSSAIGGGEFEFEPDKLDLKVARRRAFIKSSAKKFIEQLESDAKLYQETGLGIAHNFKEDIVRILLELVIKER